MDVIPSRLLVLVELFILPFQLFLDLESFLELAKRFRAWLRAVGTEVDEKSMKFSVELSGNFLYTLLFVALGSKD